MLNNKPFIRKGKTVRLVKELTRLEHIPNTPKLGATGTVLAVQRVTHKMLIKFKGTASHISCNFNELEEID